MTDDWAKKKLAELHARAPKKPADKKAKYAYVPLPWGYRALTVAGRGAVIVLHALHVQKTTSRGDVPITAAFIRQWGIDDKLRGRTLAKLQAEGLALVCRRGKKHRGCPLLTMLIPKK